LQARGSRFPFPLPSSRPFTVFAPETASPQLAYGITTRSDDDRTADWRRRAGRGLRDHAELRATPAAVRRRRSKTGGTLLVGLAATAIALPIALLPVVTVGAAVAFGVGVAGGFAAGRKNGAAGS